MVSDIKADVEAVAAALRARPERARRTLRTTTRLTSGFACETHAGDKRIVSDWAVARAENLAGPVPGQLVSAALGSCVAMGYVLWAARLGIRLDGVEVVVEGDIDLRGVFAVDEGVPKGHTEFRYTALVSSPDPPERLRELSEAVDRGSAVLDDLRRALPVSGELRVTNPTATG